MQPKPSSSELTLCFARTGHSAATVLFVALVALALAAPSVAGAAYKLVLTPVNPTVGEGSNLVAQLSLQGCTNPSNVVTIRVSTQATSGTPAAATPGVDLADPNPIQFDIGSNGLTRQITVPTIQDTLNEPDERFDLVLTVQGLGALQCTGGVEGPAAATVRLTTTIVDNDAIALSVSDPSPISEGNSGTRPVSFVVSVSPLPQQPVVVSFATQDGTARAADHDYQPVSGTLTFDGQQSSRTVTVQVQGDTAAEPNESFSLVLSAPTNHGVLSKASGAVTILNDDGTVPPPSGGPTALTPVGELNRSAAANQLLELAVRVTGASGPVAGATVTWRVEGSASLVGSSTSLSAANGVAVEVVRAGSRGGGATVFAATDGVQTPVEFHITTSGNLAGLFDPVTEPGAHSLATAIDDACRQTADGLPALCAALSDLSTDDRRQVVTELLPTEVAAQATVASEVALAQLRQLEDRLSDLRRSGGGRQAMKLSLQLGRTPLPAGIWSALGRRATTRTLSHTIDTALIAGTRARSGPAVARNADAKAVSTPATPDAETSAAEGDERLGLFLSGSAAFGDADSQAEQSGFKLDTKGLTGGVDYRVNSNFAIGLAGGYLDNGTDLDHQDGKLDVKGWSVSSYGTYYNQSFFVEGAASWGQNSYDVKRQLTLPAPFGSQSLSGAFDGQEAAATLGLGYDATHGQVTFESFGRANWLDTKLDAFTESGGSVGLAIDEQHVRSLLGELGVELSSAFSPTWGVLLLQVRLAALHEFEDGERAITGHLLGSTDSSGFTLPTAPPDRDYLHAAVGLAATLPHGRSLFVNYDQDFARDDLAVGMVSAGLRLAF